MTATGPVLLAGVDDATKCPCIGSIFVAGVSAGEAVVERWRSLGVRDSKLISPGRREKLEAVIRSTASAWAVRQVTPRMIDDKRRNLNLWEMRTVLAVLRGLLGAGDVRRVWIDNWEVSAAHFFARWAEALRGSRLQDRLEALTVIPEHYADENYTIVGAASILAKTASDRQYARFRRVYGDFGSGSPADPRTRLFVWRHRHDPPPIIRTSWKTCRDLFPLADIADDPMALKRRPAGRKAEEPGTGEAFS